jgi:hypothetical protein
MGVDFAQKGNNRMLGSVRSNLYVRGEAVVDDTLHDQKIARLMSMSFEKQIPLNDAVGLAWV